MSLAAIVQSILESDTYTPERGKQSLRLPTDEIQRAWLSGAYFRAGISGVFGADHSGASENDAVFLLLQAFAQCESDLSQMRQLVIEAEETGIRPGEILRGKMP